MKTRILTPALIAAFVAVLIGSVFAKPQFYSPKETIKDILSDRSQDTCTSVKQAVGQGLSAKDVVKTGILLGHSPCLVIKCSIKGGGNLDDIVAGATEAGVDPSVVSKCCVDAGADPKQVARTLVQVGLPGLCYIQPGDRPTPPPTPTPPPPPVSPYRFR